MDVAAAALDERLRLVSTDRLQEPSSCEGWSIYDLINHVNGGGHRYLMLLQGADAGALAATRTQDHVGGDPAGSFWRWQKPLADEFAAHGALARVAHHPVGDRSGRDLLGMRTLDLALHAWDLARSLGLDECIDPDLARYLLAHQMQLVEELRGHGLYGDERDVHGTDPQWELLSRTGRG
jgi:uncharacterized protein (TIGR03086 family)